MAKIKFQDERFKLTEDMRKAKELVHLNATRNA